MEVVVLLVEVVVWGMASPPASPSSGCGGVSRAQRIVCGPRCIEPGSVLGGKLKTKRGR